MWYNFGSIFSYTRMARRKPHIPRSDQFDEGDGAESHRRPRASADGLGDEKPKTAEVIDITTAVRSKMPLWELAGDAEMKYLQDAFADVQRGNFTHLDVLIAFLSQGRVTYEDLGTTEKDFQEIVRQRTHQQTISNCKTYVLQCRAGDRAKLYILNNLPDTITLQDIGTSEDEMREFNSYGQNQS